VPHPTPEHPEIRIFAHGIWRTHGQLDREDEPRSPSADDILMSAADTLSASRWWLTGGEPTLRPDLPALLSTLHSAGAPPLGLVTDGQALTSEAVVAALGKAGLAAVRIQLHSGRADAHDWLVGLKGAAKRVRRAMQTCASAGLRVEVETVITRSTAPYLEETVAFAARLGASTIVLRPPRAIGPAGKDYVTVSPRLALLEPVLRGALSVARRQPMLAMVEGLPRCVVGEHAVLLTAAHIRHIGHTEPIPGVSPRCDGCQGPPHCDGARSAYVDRFGWTELRSVDNQVERVDPTPIPFSEGAVPPPPRALRRPATRVRFATQQAARHSLGGDPMAGVARFDEPNSIRVSFDGASRVSCPQCGDHGRSTEPTATRTIKQRLVEAAQQGAPLLRVASAASLAHPDVGHLLADCRRLSFPEIEICGEASALDELTDREMRRTRGITRVYAALYGPDAPRHDAHVGRPGAFSATLNGLHRMSELMGAHAVSYAVLHNEADLIDFSAAWQDGELPGDPAFRLSPRGGSLHQLAEAAHALPESVRYAIASNVPPCLLARPADVLPAEQSTVAWGDGSPEQSKPSGSDRLGTYNGCPHALTCSGSSSCPGLAEGWDSAGIAPI
jgi:hypothetical protein